MDSNLLFISGRLSPKQDAIHDCLRIAIRTKAPVLTGAFVVYRVLSENNCCSLCGVIP